MYAQLMVMLGNAYSAEDVTKQFSIEPTMEQKLQDKIVEKSEFLGMINVISVDEMSGEVILGYANGPASGRTDTSGDNKRKPRNLLGMESSTYQLHNTDSDVYITFKTIDIWAKFKDLPTRYTGYVQGRIANDREIIGWYGEKAEATTNLETYPMMQDVNKGWMQIMREKKPGNIIVEGVEGSGVIKIGKGGDYENLHHAVADMKMGIPKYLRNNLIVLVGDELVGEQQVALYKATGDTPTENVLVSQATALIGGLPWMTPSNFPGRGLVVTTLSNLSIYHQGGSWRRFIKENPEMNRIDDFNSRNEGYVVEVLEQFVALEFKDDNIKITRDGGTTWE